MSRVKHGNYTVDIKGKRWRVRLVTLLARRAYRLAYRLNVRGVITFTVNREAERRAFDLTNVRPFDTVVIDDRTFRVLSISLDAHGGVALNLGQS